MEIDQRAHRLAVEVHQMTLSLPKHEMYEEGSQIRRSSKSVAAQIVEGYCLRKNKTEFIQYLDLAYAGAHETVEHLELLFQTNSLTDQSRYEELLAEYEILCKMIFRFMEGVIAGHAKPGFVRGDALGYDTPNAPHISPISHLTSG